MFGGHRRDAQTVEKVLDDVRQRFGLERVVWVSDRGMMTSDNVALLRRRGQGYLLGLNRRRREQVDRYIEQAQGEWQPCPLGIAAAEKSDPPRTQVQEVAGDEAGVRVFVVHSEEREQYERAQRERAMEALGEQLEALVKRLAAGRLKAPEKVGAAAARILSRHHGQRYFGWEYEAGRFRYFEHPQKLPREKALEGKYLIQTEEQNLTPVEAVSRYKELMAVERAFRDLKDVIEMRPIYHQTPRRVEAHIFVAALALLLKHAVQRKLKQAGMDLSAEEALGALATVQLVDLELPAGRAKRLLTRGTRRAQQVLQGPGDSRPHAARRPRPKTPYVVAHLEPRPRFFNHLEIFLPNMG